MKQYSERNALAVLLALRWRACAMRVAGWYRKTDLTRIVRKRQIWDTYGRTYPRAPKVLQFIDPMVVRWAPLKSAANTVKTVPNDATRSV